MIFHALIKLHCTFTQTHLENHLISELMIRSSFVCRKIGHLRIHLVNNMYEGELSEDSQYKDKISTINGQTIKRLNII